MGLEELYQRERDRDLFLEEQMTKAYREVSTNNPQSFFFALMEILIRYLKEKKHQESFRVTEAEIAGSFFIDFLKDVASFSYNIAEKNALVARFLGRISISNLSSFHYELNKRELLELPPEDFD